MKENLMSPMEWFIWAMRSLALISLLMASLVELFAKENKHEREVRLLLSSIAYSVIALSLEA